MNDNQIFISLGLLIFNPYLARYFIAVPTSLLDIIFIISLEIIILAFLSNKKSLFYFGIFLSTVVRQNGLIILIILIFGKIYHRKKSKIDIKDVLIICLIYFSIFSINTIYALNSQGDESNIKNLYKLTLFGLFKFNYSFLEFLKYILFPLLSFGPMVLYLLYLKKVCLLDKIILKSEISLFIILLSILIIGVAFVGGPEITGKNLNRLSNFSYICLLL